MVAVAILVGAGLPAEGEVVAAAAAPLPESSAVVQPPGGDAAHQAESEHAAAEGGHEEGLWLTIARLLNFAILVGGLGYLLRKPVANYLQQRGVQIRRDLVEAEQMRRSASEQIASLEEKLRALPGEIDALKARGADEVAAEDRRIAEAAETERQRLLEQTRREIELQVRMATQQLRREAADLTVGVASERIRGSLTPETHLRLVDRYADRVSQLERSGE